MNFNIAIQHPRNPIKKIEKPYNEWVAILLNQDPSVERLSGDLFLITTWDNVAPDHAIISKKEILTGISELSKRIMREHMKVVRPALELEFL